MDSRIDERMPFSLELLHLIKTITAIANHNSGWIEFIDFMKHHATPITVDLFSSSTHFLQMLSVVISIAARQPM